jgi:hypothetical protein
MAEESKPWGSLTTLGCDQCKWHRASELSGLMKCHAPQVASHGLLAWWVRQDHRKCGPDRRWFEHKLRGAQ